MPRRSATRSIASTTAFFRPASSSTSRNSWRAIAAATVDLKEAVKNFQTLVTGPGRQAGYPEDNVKPPATEDEAELAAVSFEAMLRGIPVAQAEGEARDAAEKKMMISATELGMAE